MRSHHTIRFERFTRPYKVPGGYGDVVPPVVLHGAVGNNGRDEIEGVLHQDEVHGDIEAVYGENQDENGVVQGK